jgi:hypothetical protein
LFPSCSKKFSKGEFKSSVQLARNALNRIEELIPIVFLPILSMKYLKKRTIKIGTDKDIVI